MNLWQSCRQLRYLLLARNWTGSSNRVFPSGSIHITSMVPKEARRTMRFPMVLIQAGDGTVDPDHGQEPDLLQHTITILVATCVPGEAVGQAAMIGANIPDRTKSEGRGLLELEEELFAAVQFLNTDTGIVIQHKASGAARATVDEERGYIAYREHTFQTLCTASRFYHPCRNLVATGGVGQVALSWLNPPDRYDRFRVLLRRASGGTAPATVTSGTGVTLSGNLASSVTNTGLGAGTYSFSLFAQYDETNDTVSQADRTSAAVSRQSVTVT